MLFVCSTIITNSQQKVSLSTQVEVSNGEINLSWNRLTSAKIHYYEIEKLTEENNWIGIRRVRPKVDQELFEVFDHLPEEGLNTYRIKVKTREGTTYVGKAVEVNFEPMEFDIMMYPNPANAWLVVNADKTDANYTVSLLDQYGNIILKKATSEGSCVLDTSEVLEGLYYVKVNGDGASMNKAIVVNHR